VTYVPASLYSVRQCRVLQLVDVQRSRVAPGSTNAAAGQVAFRPPSSGLHISCDCNGLVWKKTRVGCRHPRQIRLAAHSRSRASDVVEGALAMLRVLTFNARR
jgi:hypothetical protein